MSERIILSTKKINIQEHTDPARPGGICDSPTGLQTRFSNGDIKITCDLCGRSALPERRPSPHHPGLSSP